MRFRLASGRCIGYRVRGVGRVVALLAPIGMDTRFWQPAMDILARDYRVVAIDYRGHGESDVTGEPFSIDGVADDCAELLRALAGGPCVVAGCSMGGATAQALAVRHAGLIRGAVLANSSGPRSAAYNAVLLDRAARVLQGMPVVLEETLKRWFSPGFAAAHPEVVRQVGEWLQEADPLVHSLSWRALQERSEDEYHLIRCPVLCITGSQDPAAGPASVQALAAAIPGASYLELEGAGHVAPLEQPQAFAAAVAAFERGIG